jgi:hypothetical protein
MSEELFLPIPVFYTKPLKRHFYTFLLLSCIIVAASFVASFLTGGYLLSGLFKATNSWIVLGIILIPNILYNRFAKKKLTAVINTADFEEQFAKYIEVFKARMMMNTVSTLVISIMYLSSKPNGFLFYFLVFHLLLLSAQYPRKNLITKDLKNNDIIFA